MALVITGTPGAPVASTGAGVSPAAGLRLTNTNEVGLSEVHGRYYEGAYRGGRFAGGMQAVIATGLSVAGATTYTGGLVLANPNGSTVNAILEKVGIGFIVAQTNAAMIGIGVGQSTTNLSGTLTSVSPRSRKIGSGTVPVCSLLSSASITLPIAPTLDTVLTAVQTGALTTAPVGGGGLFDLDGGIVLPPGAFAMIWSSAAGTASSMIASMQWEEVPI
jgi:hypothetical protein